MSHDPLSELRDLILALSDTAEELGRDETALELRSIAGGLAGDEATVRGNAAALPRTVLAWCLEARQSRGLTHFSIGDTVWPPLSPPKSFAVHLVWGDRHDSFETFDPGCPPHVALDRLERVAITARNATEEHARRNPGISRVLDWSMETAADRVAPDGTFIRYEGGP